MRIIFFHMPGFPKLVPFPAAGVTDIAKRVSSYPISAARVHFPIEFFDFICDKTSFFFQYTEKKQEIYQNVRISGNVVRSDSRILLRKFWHVYIIVSDKYICRLL